MRIIAGEAGSFHLLAPILYWTPATRPVPFDCCYECNFGGHETPSLRKVPIETLVFQVIQNGGPILYHNDSEEQQRSFESTCSKFRRFLEENQNLVPARRRWK